MNNFQSDCTGQTDGFFQTPGTIAPGQSTSSLIAAAPRATATGATFLPCFAAERQVWVYDGSAYQRSFIPLNAVIR
jgi:hypothetical protein